MVNKLRKLVATYISSFANMEDWKEIKSLYFVYTYVCFLVLILNNRGVSCFDVPSQAVALGLETKDNLDCLFSFKGTQKLLQEVEKLAIENKEEINDISMLYQAFIAVDYFVKDGKIIFEEGKNNRDILGAYYTQDAFSFEITQKAIDEYINNHEEPIKEISIADFSCGSGSFLASAQKYCAEKGILVHLFGIDVDPVAIMITKDRLRYACSLKSDTIRIVLGNPLLTSSPQDGEENRFLVALKGQYYHPCMRIIINEKYDIVIGNPPWEKIRFEGKKFLSHYMPKHLIDTEEKRKKEITSALEGNKTFYCESEATYENAKKDIKKNVEFQYTRVGELNTYALFTEYALNHTSNNGVTGLIVKSSLLKMPVYRDFLKKCMDSKEIYEIYMFINKNKIFDIDSREEFSVVFFKKQNQEDLRVAFALDSYQNFFKQEKISLSRATLELLNPETGMLPNIKDNGELKFLCRIYSENPTFGESYQDAHFGRLVHLTNHSQYITKEPRQGYLPVYEGKFIELYTGKYATFRNMEYSEKYKNKATAKIISDITGTEYPESRFFIKSDVWENMAKNFHGKYIVTWRSLTSATNKRTMLATLLPLIPTCQSIQLLQFDDEEKMLQVLALFNSIVFDYIVRLKMVGLDLTQTIIKQIPVPSRDKFNKTILFQGENAMIKTHIISRLKTLYENDIRVRNIFKHIPSYEVSERPRKKIIAELDNLVGTLYGLQNTELRKIAESFGNYYSQQEVKDWFAQSIP